MTPGTSEAGRRLLLRRLYTQYAEEPALTRVRTEAGGVLVPGYGPMKPRLMFVGEAPGAREHKHRMPFVGASGQLLDAMLGSVGIERRDVFITNAVKYRPVDANGNNRSPADEEVWAGITYLRREHVLVGRPPMVMLGRHARNTLTGAMAGHPVGKWFWFNVDGGFPVLPLHHPAYGIYQRANRPMMFEQFKAVLTPPSSPQECM